MRKVSGLVIVLIILGVAAFFWWGYTLSPVDPSNTQAVTFTIQPGSGIKAIATELKKQHLIKNTLVFTLMVKQLGLEKKIQAGQFRLSPSLSSRQIAESLTKGTEDAWVTIPEGKRAEEVAEILKDKLSNYDPSWQAELDQHEGYLFPDTYQIPHDADIATIVKILTTTFDQKYEQVDTSRTTLSQNQIVTLASLIEREARHPQDRPLISSVLHNRLDLGMALQIDATVQYALGYDQSQGTWWRNNLTLAEVQVSSPYNTYRQPGLPPGPIASPGLSSLQAAANPSDTNYLYYITDKNLINHYATTLEQHNANIRKYGL
ncbi:MAG: endolytic transglycosylase MltG [Patescibacteria group bacterium]